MRSRNAIPVLLLSSLIFGASIVNAGVADNAQAGWHTARVSASSIQHRNAQTVRTFLRRLEEKDIAGWGQLWADEGRQDMPYAPSGFPSALVGKARLMQHFSKLPQAMEYMRFQDLLLHLTNDPHVVIAQFRGDIKVANSSKKYDNVYINVFRFRPDGKLRQVVEYFNPLILIESAAFEPCAPEQAQPAFDTTPAFGN